MKSKKLNKDQVEKIVDKRTNFNVILSIRTGLVAEFNADDGTYFTSEEISLTDLDVVTIKYDKNVRKRLGKYADKLLGMRGVKDIDGIDANDHDVQGLYKNWKKRVGKRHIPRKEQASKYSTFIETIKREHKPQYLLVMFQLFSWAILYDDMFSVVKGKGIDCKFELEISDEYWEQRLSEEEEVDVDLDALLGDYIAPKITFDNTNPLEHMIALVAELLNGHEEFAAALSEYYTKAFAGVSLINSNKEFDDAGFLNSALDELLADDDVEEDNSGE